MWSEKLRGKREGIIRGYNEEANGKPFVI